MKLARVFLTSAAVSVISLVALYVALFTYQMGAPIPATYVVQDWVRLKERIAADTPGRRILMLADSNVLFGFDSEYAEKRLGRPVINMGLHGGLPLDWILGVAERNAKPGDLLVLPLTWHYYLQDYRLPNSWMVDQIVAWNSDYFYSLPWTRRLRYMAAITPGSMFRNLKTQLFRAAVLKRNPMRLLASRDEALAHYDKVASAESEFSYSYLNFSPRGDMRHTCGKSFAASGKSAGIFAGAKPNKVAFDLLTEKIRNLQARGVSVFLSAGVSVDDETSRAPWFQAVLDGIWAEFERRELPVLGTPTDYFFPQKAFFDTHFHLNCDYAVARTERVVERLLPIIDNHLPAPEAVGSIPSSN